MPTSYTAPIEEGDLSLRSFMLRAVRGMAAAFRLRDNPLDVDLDAVFIDEHSRTEVEFLERRLEEMSGLLALSDAEIELMLDARAAEDLALLEESRLKLGRYEEVLDKLDRWSPPTPDHAGFKDFMREQILMSMEPHQWLVDSLPAPRPSAGDYRTEMIACCNEEIDRAHLRVLKARASASEDAAWIMAFMDSLPDE